jgi:hypothetical protein
MSHSNSRPATSKLGALMACVLGVFLSGSLLSNTLCLGDEASMSSAFKQFMAAPDNPIILRGDYLKATSVALRDFQTILARRGDHAGQSPESTLNLSLLENYDVSIDQTASSYIVQFGPTVRNHATVVFGGGARYVIDRSRFAITQKTMLK